MSEEKPDLQFHNHGSIVTCHARTEEGLAWLEEHVATDNYHPVVIEPRFLENLVVGAREDGLVCNG